MNLTRLAPLTWSLAAKCIRQWASLPMPTWAVRMYAPTAGHYPFRDLIK